MNIRKVQTSISKLCHISYVLFHFNSEHPSIFTIYFEWTVDIAILQANSITLQLGNIVDSWLTKCIKIPASVSNISFHKLFINSFGEGSLLRYSVFYALPLGNIMMFDVAGLDRQVRFLYSTSALWVCECTQNRQSVVPNLWWQQPNRSDIFLDYFLQLDTIVHRKLFFIRISIEL